MSLVDHLGELRNRLFRVDPRGRRRRGRSGSTSPARSSTCSCDPIPDGSRPDPHGPGDGFVDHSCKIAIVIGVILAMPVLLYQVWAFVVARPDPDRAQDRAAVDPARALLLRARRRDRLLRPAVRGRRSCSASTIDRPRQHCRRRPVLRLRDHDVPGLRPGDGVPDPARRPVARRHPDLGAAAPSRRDVILGIAIFAAVTTPAVTSSARSCSAARCTCCSS